jgi:hypothetical protein
VSGLELSGFTASEVVITIWGGGSGLAGSDGENGAGFGGTAPLMSPCSFLVFVAGLRRRDMGPGIDELDSSCDGVGGNGEVGGDFNADKGRKNAGDMGTEESDLLGECRNSLGGGVGGTGEPIAFGVVVLSSILL